MAETEVGALVVRMKADLSEYLQKLDQMEKKTTDSTSKVSQAFSSITKVFTSAGVAIGSVALTAINAAMKWGTAVDDLSDKTGMAGEEASKLLVVAKRVGIGAEEASMMFSRFARSAYNAAEAQVTAANSGKQADDAYTKLGITLTKSDNTMKSASEIFGEVKEKISAMPDGLQKTAMEMELFGRSGAEMHDLLNMTAEEMQTVIDKAESMGLILSTQQAAAWEKFERDVNTAKGSLTSLGIVLGNEMMPHLRSILSDVQSVTKAYVNMDGKQKEIVNGLISFVGQVGAATIAVKGLEWVIGRSLGPWGLVAVAIWKAVEALRAWNTQNDTVRDVFVWDGPNHGHSVKIHDLPTERGGSERWKNYNDTYPTQDKQQPPPKITGSAGDSGSDTEKTELQKYQEETGKLVSIWQSELDLNRISRDQFKGLLSERLDGLNSIAAGENELLDKQQAQLSLQTQIKDTDKQAAQDAAKASQDAIAIASQKVQLGEISVEQYRTLLNSQMALAKTEKDRLAIAVQLQNENEKIVANEIKRIDGETAAKKSALSKQEEDERHKLQMAQTFSANTLEAKRANWAAETVLAETNLDRQYKLDSAAIDDKLKLYANDKEKYKELLVQKKQLDDKYLLDKAKLENAYAEKVAAQQRAIIDSNNSMIADLIAGTRSGHDILKSMWADFVSQVVAKMFSIQTSLNPFTALFGGLFNLDSGKGGGFSYNSPGVALAGGYGGTISLAVHARVADL